MQCNATTHVHNKRQLLQLLTKYMPFNINKLKFKIKCKIPKMKTEEYIFKTKEQLNTTETTNFSRN